MAQEAAENKLSPKLPPQKVMDILDAADFYREANRKIYLVMIDLSLKGEAIDLVTVTERLRGRGKLDQVGGVTYLSMLVDSIPTAANIISYARIIKEKSILRLMIDAATSIVSRCYSDIDDVDELVDVAERTIIFEVAEKRVNPAFSPIETIVKDSFKAIETLYESPDLKIPT